jgi:hypothetical protein
MATAAQQKERKSTQDNKTKTEKGKDRKINRRHKLASAR